MGIVNLNPRRSLPQMPSSMVSLLYGLALSVAFAVLFFNPFTYRNIAFAVQTEPAMFLTPPADLSLLALLYFAVAGLVLGGLRLLVWQRVRGVTSPLISWSVLFVGSAAFIYGALRLFNPALDCMIESCNSTFVLNYAVVTLGFSAILAYNPRPAYSNDLQPEPDSKPGCLSGQMLVLVGAAIFICSLVYLYAMNNPARGC